MSSTRPSQPPNPAARPSLRRSGPAAAAAAPQFRSAAPQPRPSMRRAGPATAAQPQFRSAPNVPPQYYAPASNVGSSAGRIHVVDPFAKTNYRAIPLGAVQAHNAGSLHQPRPPMYRSLSTSAAPYGHTAQPVYRSINLAGAQRSSFHAGPFVPGGPVKGAIGGGGGTVVDPFDPFTPVKSKSAGNIVVGPSSDPFEQKPSLRPSIHIKPQVGSAALDPAVPVPPEMPPPPFYLERAHFYSQRSVPELIRNIESELRKNEKIDYTFDPTKCKWKIDLYVNNHHLEVKARMYNISSKRLRVIEFNRRKGESFVFCSWYRALLHGLVEKAMVCDEAGATRSGSLGAAFPRTPGGVVRTAPVPSIGADCLKPLLEMAKARFRETQAEAVREVANLSNKAENRPEIVQAGFLGPLLTLLQSQDSDVHRCAAVCIANLADNCQCSDSKAKLQSAANQAVPTLCAILTRERDTIAVPSPPGSPVQKVCFGSTHCMRQSGRAVANLVGCGYALQPQNKQVLQEMMQSRCTRLLAHCQQALQCA